MKDGSESKRRLRNTGGGPWSPNREPNNLNAKRGIEDPYKDFPSISGGPVVRLEYIACELNAKDTLAY